MQKPCQYGSYVCHEENGVWWHRDDCFDMRFDRAVNKMREGAKELEQLDRDMEEQQSRLE